MFRDGKKCNKETEKNIEGYKHNNLKKKIIILQLIKFFQFRHMDRIKK